MDFDALPDPEDRPARPAVPEAAERERAKPIAGMWVAFALCCLVAALMPLSQAAKLAWWAGPCVLAALACASCAWWSRKRSLRALAALALCFAALAGSWLACAQALARWMALDPLVRSLTLSQTAHGAAMALACSAGFAVWNKLSGPSSWAGGALACAAAASWIMGWGSSFF
jgi:hypothetical protein